jgi:phytoene synthase
MLLAEDDAQRRDAAAAFGGQLFRLSGGAEATGHRWGLIWGAGVPDGEREARQLIADARSSAVVPRADFAGNRALLMLDRWAVAIAAHGGERRWRSEGLLLFRIGLLGR